ncbi:formyltransferase family protein [Helicovermis profundi]|uniref:Formyltransferase family protein n=1 Tax=Helicovermis profundi TaxID=3065157 RepID=A0AAU9E6H8_9FIRM|nr:formyltransferase family protein [Clostridia bacterium S502]
MKVLFIGSVESSYILLNELINHEVEICGVITKKESKFNSDFCDLASICASNNIEYVYSETSRDNDTFEFIKNKAPDIIYCFGWSYLLSEEIINIPKLGTVGFHPAKLPYNKGRHPLIWALVLGVKTTASTFFMIDEKADNGDLVSQIEVPIDIKDDANSLYNKVMQVAKEQVIQITKAFSEGSITFIKQNPNEGNVWRKRGKSDGKIDFRMTSMGIYNLVRGLSKPYVGAHFELNGCDYKVWSTEIVGISNSEYENIEPGKVISVYSDKSFTVKTGDGLIKILESDGIDLRVGDYL